MSNITPNLELHKMRLRLRLSEMELSLQRADVRLLELDDEKRIVGENKTATATAIVELKKELEAS